MKILTLSVLGLCLIVTLTECGSNSGSTAMVTGKASFVLGGSAATRTFARARAVTRPTPGLDYSVSPNKAKITFTSVVFRDASGGTIATSTLSGCTVTYDRSQASGTSLLDCDLQIPVGEISQIAVGFSKTIQLLIDDSGASIFTDSTTSTGFTTTRTNEPDFVNFHVTAGGTDSDERSTPVIFPAPITVAAGSTPQLFITTDMVHGTQLTADAGGASLSPSSGTSDPVALFGGLTKGTSLYFSEATTIGAFAVSGQKSVRMFLDSSGQPLYVIGYTCGVDGPKGAWASPPVGAKIGGWLGKDSANKIAWALPTDTTYATYSAFFVMDEQLTVGMTTTVKCEASSSPPVPADGKTYASGAPTITPTVTPTLTLLAK